MAKSPMPGNMKMPTAQKTFFGKGKKGAPAKSAGKSAGAMKKQTMPFMSKKG